MRSEDSCKLDKLRDDIIADRDRRERRDKITESKDARVIGGITRREPVNRAASMLLAKAPWYHQPVLKPRFEEEKKERGRVGMAEKARIPSSVVGCMEEMLPDDAKDRTKLSLIKNLDNIARYEKGEGVELLMDCASAYTEAMDAVSQSVIGFRSEMDRLNEATSDALGSIRSKRHAMIKETAESLQCMRELRQFFIGPDYRQEIDRLKEFIEVCEKLQALKSSGFLDTVSETMLNMAIGGGE